MNLSMKWLADYVDIGPVSPREFSEAMTMSGSKVEGWEFLGEEIRNVVLARVNSIEKHPDSDHLVICQVEIGGGNVNIVVKSSGLQANEAAQLNEIVVNETGISADKIKIIEVK